MPFPVFKYSAFIHLLSMPLRYYDCERLYFSKVKVEGLKMTTTEATRCAQFSGTPSITKKNKLIYIWLLSSIRLSFFCQELWASERSREVLLWLFAMHALSPPLCQKGDILFHFQEEDAEARSQICAVCQSQGVCMNVVLQTLQQSLTVWPRDLIYCA